MLKRLNFLRILSWGSTWGDVDDVEEATPAAPAPGSWRGCRRCRVRFNRKPGPLGRLELCTRCATRDAGNAQPRPGDGTVGVEPIAAQGGAEIEVPEPAPGPFTVGIPYVVVVPRRQEFN